MFVMLLKIRVDVRSDLQLLKSVVKLALLCGCTN